MSRLRWLGAILLFVLAFIIYALSLSPGVFSWDSAELTLGIYSQGIVHATGYPLYLILGRLFTLLPLSADFAIRTNLFSAFCGALTVALLYAINLRLFKQPIIAAASALLYGLAGAIWAQAVVAEVYTLHTALVAGIMLLVIALGSKPRATSKPETPDGVGKTPQQISGSSTSLEVSNPFVAKGFEPLAAKYGLAILFGLALANHMAAGLVALVVLPYVLWKTPTWRVRIITLGIIGVVAGTLYLYLPLRFAAQPQFNLVAHYFDRSLTQPGDLLWMVSGRMFGREMFAYPLLDWVGEIGKFAGELWLNFLGVGLLLGLLGIVYLWGKNRTICLLLLAIFGAQVLFFSSYDVFDKWTMFHTAYLTWGVFVAAGGVWLLAAGLPKIAVYVFLAALVMVQLAGNWNSAGRSGDTFVADRSQNLLTALPPDATLIGPWTAIRPTEYQQIVNDLRPDVKLVDVTLLALGERDRLTSDASDALTQAVDARLLQAVACAPGDVYVIDPAALDVNLYEVAYVESGLYRVTRHPAADC